MNKSKSGFCYFLTELEKKWIVLIEGAMWKDKTSEGRKSVCVRERVETVAIKRLVFRVEETSEVITWNWRERKILDGYYYCLIILTNITGKYHIMRWNEAKVQIIVQNEITVE